jgi:hypothetical protein
MKTPPVGPTGGTPESSAKEPKVPSNLYSGVHVSAEDPWYKYAQQMFPNQKITPEIIAGLKKNMMTMINTTIGQINKRQAKAQEYNKKVAQGEE